jgi:hypothetical protein
MTEPPIYRYDVTFEATQIDQGRSIVRLALSRRAPPRPRHHVLLRAQGGDDARGHRTPGRFLNQYVARFGIVLPEEDEPQGAEETSEQA